jgi:hypothetical protein
MTLELIRSVLGWCALINMGLLLFSFFMIIAMRSMIHKIHGRWFKLSPEQFDMALYRALVGMKTSVFIFNIAPWIALHIVA